MKNFPLAINLFDRPSQACYIIWVYHDNTFIISKEELSNDKVEILHGNDIKY